MALVFKTSEEINVELGRNGGDVENLGTFAALLPKGTKIKFSPKNLLKKDKLVTVVLTSKDGKLAFMPCSSSVNGIVRELLGKGTDKKQILKWLSTLEVIENAVGMFISRPMGEANDGITIDDLKKVEIEAFNPEELIAF